MITGQELKGSKKRFAILMVKWFWVSFFGFWSTLVIWEFVFKNLLKIPGFYIFMNDTKDGDYGAQWWLDEKGLSPSIWSAVLWWIRNHSWNYIRKYLPEWDGGRVDKDKDGEDEFEHLILTIEEEDMKDSKGRHNRFMKASSRKGIYGINYYVYRLNGKVFFNYSRATPFLTIQIGAGGNEYRLWFKPRILAYLKWKVGRDHTVG